MKKEIEYIGRSKIAIPTEKNDGEILMMQSYGSYYTWRGQTNYYNLYHERKPRNFLGFHHTPTGVLLGFRASRSANPIIEQLYSNGDLKIAGQWKALPVNEESDRHKYLTKMLEFMDTIDSDRMNWNVVSMHFKDKWLGNYSSLYLYDGNGYFIKNDLSYFFDVGDILQVGFKDMPKDGVYKYESEKIKQTEKENKMKEMII
tara:strand:+ start:1299 stop:1904 length:606 start_codon:yes stop_codon:yes gene_type:complete